MAESKAGSLEATFETQQTDIAPGEIVLGTVAGIDPSGRPLVDYGGNPADSPLVALSTIGVTHQHIHRQVALLFAEGDCRKPVIMGLIHSPLFTILEGLSSEEGQHTGTAEQRQAAEADGQDDKMVAHVDGDRVVIEGKQEITLKCGEASITLTRAGKILIRGKYLLSRSSGVNRIQGGSVQVN